VKIARAFEPLSQDEMEEIRAPICIAAVLSRSFRDALARLARYKRHTCPEELVVQERGDEGRVRLRWLLADEAEPPLLVDLAFSWFAAIARRGSGGRIGPRRIELRAASGKRGMYEEHFGCPVKLGARENAIVFARTDLDRPFLTHNPDLLAVIAPQLDAELSKTAQPEAVGEQVKRVLKPLLAGRRPAIKDVARELALSSRTLQRRLTESGLTFQQLVQDARRELAHHYLLHSSMELTETAYLLGYEDAHSFFRAFQQWEGTPPGAWRAQHSRSPRPRPVVHAV
jgi:AraC-like DNA-binding protein